MITSDNKDSIINAINNLKGLGSSLSQIKWSNGDAVNSALPTIIKDLEELTLQAIEELGLKIVSFRHDYKLGSGTSEGLRIAPDENKKEKWALWQAHFQGARTPCIDEVITYSLYGNFQSRIGLEREIITHCGAKICPVETNVSVDGRSVGLPGGWRI